MPTFTINIVQAIYASNNKGVDVTDKVKALLTVENPEGRFVPSQVFADCDVGHRKYCGVLLDFTDSSGAKNRYAVAADQDVTMELLPDGFHKFGIQPPCGVPTNGTKVSQGWYAGPFGGNDVSAIVQARINLAAKNVFVDPVALGPDPSVGRTKCLVLSYGGQFKAGCDGQTLTF